MNNSKSFLTWRQAISRSFNIAYPLSFIITFASLFWYAYRNSLKPGAELIKFSFLVYISSAIAITLLLFLWNYFRRTR